MLSDKEMDNKERGRCKRKKQRQKQNLSPKDTDGQVKKRKEDRNNNYFWKGKKEKKDGRKWMWNRVKLPSRDTPCPPPPTHHNHHKHLTGWWKKGEGEGRAGGVKNGPLPPPTCLGIFHHRFLFTLFLLSFLASTWGGFEYCNRLSVFACLFEYFQTWVIHSLLGIWRDCSLNTTFRKILSCNNQQFTDGNK